MTVPYKEIFQRVHDTVTKPEAEKPAPEAEAKPEAEAAPEAEKDVKE